MTELDAMLAGIVADPREEIRWLVLADWLQEYDDSRRAKLLRLHRKMLATCCEPDAHPQRAEWQARMVELLIAGVKPCVSQETLTLPGGVPLTFSFIPPGAFLMGSESVWDNEQPIHCVVVPRGFFIGVFPVTQRNGKPSWVHAQDTSRDKTGRLSWSHGITARSFAPSSRKRVAAQSNCRRKPSGNTPVGPA